MFCFNHIFNNGILAGLMFVYKKNNPSNPVVKYPFYSQSIFRVVVVVFLETGSLEATLDVLEFKFTEITS